MEHEMAAPAAAGAMEDARPDAALADLHKTLGFRIERRGGMRLKVDDDGSVGTATADELAMYDMIVGPLAAVTIGGDHGAEPEAQHRDWLLMALSSCLAAQTDMVEILRDEQCIVPNQIYGREVVENLACAMQSAIGLAIQTPTPDHDQAEMLGQLQAAVGRFLEGWA
jgi:hypothetical protein